MALGERWTPGRDVSDGNLFSSAHVSFPGRRLTAERAGGKGK